MPTSWAIEQGFLTAFSFIGFALVLIPLFWHLEAWNIGCILYIFWTGTICLIQFINHIMWRDNAINFAPVWCDITIRITYAGRIGIIAASLVIARRISKIATGTTVSSTRSDKRRVILTDLAIGLSFPLAQFVIYWFVQGHRFDIFEGIGCLSAMPNTYLYVCMYTAWPIAMGLVSATYCCITLRAFLKRRKQFSELLQSNSSLTFNRYFRLMAMAGLEIICTVPLATYNVVSTLTQSQIYPWKGLGDLHLNFGRVRQYPVEIWTTQFVAFKSGQEANEWMVIGCALVFFLIFGMAEEARKHYRSAYTSVAKRVGLSTGSLETTAGFSTSKGVTSSGFGKITIPTFMQRNTSKRDSLGSFSDRLSTAISVGEFNFDDEKLAPYSPSEVSGGSSSCLPTPLDEKSHSPELNEKEAEISEIQVPAAALDVESVRRHSPTPDVPSTIRNSVDMV